ncbi:RidA family protein [Flagellimonas flava]|uniref:Enamine deaminase RidA, house cleaning of reactive enamine intermediates, YjgF/YER057c/UK114 family n=1 Tax=Flagellimonas flava TaxID=570519 RepID=A0A1M5HZF4_9FLAO|nr:RidA family protein [Allomuricauda flava]SHG21160.1 Enamine deaminase RidA, house cleaning of reactive enamine intermediates, YjgF/YER057c/UK114 family [Allomuricauda flava]
MEKTDRRSAFKKLGMGVAALLGAGSVKAMGKAPAPKKEVVGEIVQDKKIPLFSGAVKHGNTLYVAGKGAHFEGDIKSHTDHVLKEIEKELVKNGSSMDKVLKVNVYLHDLEDYHGMNEVYRGRFGENPPVRTTVAVYGGVPGDSLVEIDCIAALD